jgi:hypothetical protein
MLSDQSRAADFNLKEYIFDAVSRYPNATDNRTDNSTYIYNLAGTGRLADATIHVSGNIRIPWSPFASLIECCDT